MASHSDSSASPLLRLLRNDLILRHSSPFLGLGGLFSLARTSKAFQHLIIDTPTVFRRIDLSNNKYCRLEQPHYSTQRSEYLSHPPALNFSTIEELGLNGRSEEVFLDEFLAHPLNTVIGHLKSREILKHVRTLILDGLVIPRSLISALLGGEIKHNIHLLSICQAIIPGSNINTFIAWLRHHIQNSQENGGSRLKGLYFLTGSDPTDPRLYSDNATSRPLTAGITNAIGAQLGSGVLDESKPSPAGIDEPWYGTLGDKYLRPLEEDGLWWGDLIEEFQELIALDATVCRHDRELYGYQKPRVADIRLLGCQNCGSCPEGLCFP